VGGVRFFAGWRRYLFCRPTDDVRPLSVGIFEFESSLMLVTEMNMDDLPENAVESLLTGRPQGKLTSLVSLNFKVPLQVRLQFKIYAARHNMTMTELLLELFDGRLTADANQSQPATFTEEGIKK
jgi:hypothetical protein